MVCSLAKNNSLGTNDFDMGRKRIRKQNYSFTYFDNNYDDASSVISV